LACREGNLVNRRAVRTQTEFPSARSRCARTSVHGRAAALPPRGRQKLYKKFPYRSAMR
jgi:hypothetical protein